MQGDAARIPIFAVTLGLLLAAAGCGEQQVERGAPLVRTESGMIRGIDAERAQQFLGIPYAAPPVGALRWKPPTPVAPWPDIRDATTLPVACAQLPSTNGPGSDAEDCLYLSVYRPANTTASSRLPVLLWIHGGGAVNGSGNQFDASTLADTGTVVVTINYRLNLFGFLALPALTAEAADHSSGNLGLVDQQAAMVWVQHNIAAFGGNPGNVTIAGESSGGGSVCFHLASPTAADLFQRAVIQSGAFVVPAGVSAFLGGGSSVPCGAATLADAEKAGSAFATSVGCQDPGSAAACMRSKSAADLLAASSSFSAGINVSGAVFPEAVLAAIQAGRWNRVPVIIGTTHDELQIAATAVPGGFPVSPAIYPVAVSFIFGAAKTPKILAEYPASNYSDPGFAFGALLTDAALACPTDTVRTLLAGLTDTYGYEFDDPDAPPGVQNGAPSGAYHSSDVHYLFDYTPYQGPTTPAQDALASQMQRYWGAFAAQGRPEVDGDPAWPRFDPQQPQVMSLRPGGSTLIDDFAEFHHCAFWNSLAS
jgi:para-nitrobenzyl esterase